MIWNAHKKEKAFLVFWFFGFPRDLEVHWARLQTTTTTTTDPTTTDPTERTTEDGQTDGTDDGGHGGDDVSRGCDGVGNDIER